MSATASSQNTTSRARFGYGRSEDVRDDEEAPRPQRYDLEDADDVVDRRVVGSLLVTVVEAVDPREQDPERKRRDEEGDLPHGRDLVGRGRRRRERRARRTYATTSPMRSAASNRRRMSQPRRLPVGGHASSIS